jgi:hypothetical protein
MARKLTNKENETQTLFEMEYGKNYSKNGENEKCTL